MVRKWEIKEEGEPEGVVNHFLETVPVPEKVENPEIGAPEVQMDDVKNITIQLKGE